MKKIFCSSILICLLAPAAHAQDSRSYKGTRVNGDVIYLVLEGEKLKYFTIDESPDSRKKVDENMRFSLKKNSCNLYIKWLNPLKYKISFRDTMLIDPRDKIIDGFIRTLAGQFGISVDTIEKERTLESYNEVRYAYGEGDKTTLCIPREGFNSVELMKLYMTLITNQNLLGESEIKAINLLTESIGPLDKKIAIDVLKEVNKIYDNLFKIDNSVQARKQIRIDSMRIENFRKDFEKIKMLQDNVLTKLNDLTISYGFLDRYIKAVITEFVFETRQTLKTNIELTSSLEGVLDVVRKSLQDESVEEKTKGYYSLKNIALDEGKILQSTIQITEFRLNPENSEKSGSSRIGNVSKTGTVNRTLVFEKYDLIDVWASSGIFYSTTSLTGYGISSNTDGDFIVSSDTIKKNSVVAAFFLNFDFDIGSRFLAPLIQIGIDPTKSKPFMLLGGGISIPCRRFSITGGALWTWHQRLDKLSVGQTISSTTELENDIRYDFDASPKGWYLGIQYNF